MLEELLAIERLQAGCRPAFAHSFIVAFIKALGAGANKLLADPDLKANSEPSQEAAGVGRSRRGQPPARSGEADARC
jgi:hypothetical protein